MSRLSIAIDMMGGDRGPSVTVPALKRVLQYEQNVSFFLLGLEPSLRARLKSAGLLGHPSIEIVPCDQIVMMGEPPRAALRTKRRSSMYRALEMVRDGQAQACVSAGNTGALVAMAYFTVRPLQGVLRPALIAGLPSLGAQGSFWMLDLGATIQATPEQLEQYALMGAVYARFVQGIERPRVALLNVGIEPVKGNELVQEAARRCAARSDLNFVGFIEGDQLFRGNADVVVADGFSGNVALKSSEGMSRVLFDALKQGFRTGLWPRLMGLLARPILKKALYSSNPAHYNGATLLGLQGVVIKSHGNTTASGFARAIDQAIVQARAEVPSRIASLLAPGSSASESPP